MGINISKALVISKEARTAMGTDLYAILGIPKTATTQEITSAYRKKALQCHSDKKITTSPKSEKDSYDAEIRAVNGAYEVLRDPKRREQYDNGDNNCFDVEQDVEHPEKIYTCEANSEYFTQISPNGKIKLNGFSKCELIVRHENDNPTLNITIELAKKDFDPMITSLENLMKALNRKAFESNRYVEVSHKVSRMYHDIMSYMDELPDDKIDHEQILRALRASQTIICAAQHDDKFMTHRSFLRNCPVLQNLCVCLDLMTNFFAFLDEKIKKAISGDTTPVFANMDAFKYGMFKKASTTTGRTVEKLKKDIAWYIETIETKYNDAIPSGYST